MTNLWTSANERRAFGWKGILQEWNRTFTHPHNVDVVIDNLRAACEPDGSHVPPISRFLSYLNNEQEGIAWFLYECISIRWLWGSIRLDYVRDLVDEIEDLDGFFPDFPGSPNETIRKFITDNLDEVELEYIEMMPPLVAPPRIQRVSTARRLDFEEKKRPSIEIRVIRNNDDSACDDVIKINPSDNTFNITYKDRHSNLNMKTYLVGSNGVIQYLKMMLRLLSIDEEPFEQVQFNIPCLPAIMVSPSELTSQTRDLVYDSVQMTLDNWPSVI